MFELMFTPFVACLILTGIHAYLGIHVIEREVIFVDLALAQIAALGAIFAFLFGIEFHSSSAFIVSMLFTFVGATIFALTRFKKKKVSQEAIIGIVYAVSAAAAILVLDRAPSEAEHIKHMLVGNILFVQWSEVLKIFVLYFLIGLFHFIYRKKFLLISLDSEAAINQKISIKWWDFLFYASFGVVITSSVEIAGVLLVFSYLIVPAVCAVLFTNSIGKRLLVGWAVGIFASLVGLYLSAKMDFPTGAAIICSFGLVLILLSFVYVMKQK
ncbi:MAG: metal ABC transporter permease [Elusimicrobia bacterium]|nr:metal ABC transporter permease [Elusimicrobiota bacterium]